MLNLVTWENDIPCLHDITDCSIVCIALYFDEYHIRNEMPDEKRSSPISME